jgi:hypothetical protein
MDEAERKARKRLEALFQAFDRLTPDELARIGYQLPPDGERDQLLAAVHDAAVRTGRIALVDEARVAAREAVMARYSAGSLHPTFVGLNWGLSQGTVENRVAIAETLADAAGAAVVEDALDPEVAAALALDAQAITTLAAGEVSDGSLARAIREPEGADMLRGPWARLGRRLGAAALVVFAVVATEVGLLGAAVVGFVVAVRGIAWRGARRGQ